MNYFFWVLLLVVQNAAFTLVSRARNSSCIWYHAVAAVFSNGVWFASQFILIVAVKEAATGSVLMHYASMR